MRKAGHLRAQRFFLLQIETKTKCDQILVTCAYKTIKPVFAIFNAQSSLNQAWAQVGLATRRKAGHLRAQLFFLHKYVPSASFIVRSSLKQA